MAAVVIFGENSFQWGLSFSDTHTDHFFSLPSKSRSDWDKDAPASSMTCFPIYPLHCVLSMNEGGRVEKIQVVNYNLLWPQGSRRKSNIGSSDLRSPRTEIFRDSPGVVILKRTNTLEDH